MKPILLFSGYSNTGKTFFLVEFIPYFVQSGYHIGYIKHHHGRYYEKKSKDTGKMREAGVARSLLVAEDTLIIEDQPHEREDPIGRYAEEYFGDCHIIFVEGFKKNKIYPKIILTRGSREVPEWEAGAYDQNVIAFISDAPLRVNIPVFSFDEKDSLFRFVIHYFGLER